MIRTILFDWDGTLHDTRHLYGEAVRTVCNALPNQDYIKNHDLSDDGLAGFLGLAGPDMWAQFMPHIPKEVREQASVRVGEELTKGVPEHSRLYQGAEETLDALKNAGYTLVILSACREIYLSAQRERWKLDRWFSGYFCTETFGFVPKSTLVPYLREKYPEPYLMVGDRASDFSLTAQWNIPSVACTYGFGTEIEYNTATCKIASIRELPSLIQRVFA